MQVFLWEGCIDNYAMSTKIPMTDGGTEEARRVRLEMIEQDTGEPTADVAEAEVSDGTVTITLEWHTPGVDGFEVTFDIEERSVNQYAHFETWKNGEVKSTYDRYNAEKMRLLFRDGDSWHFGKPQVPMAVKSKAGRPQSELKPDGHHPTQVDGITARSVASRSNPRDSFHKTRFKVLREFVESVDEAYVLTYREKHEAGREGAYTRQSETVAHKLTIDNE